MFKKHWPFFVFLALYFLFAFITYKNYGISYDERNVYLRGKLFYIKTIGNDKILQKDFVIKNGENNANLISYNNLYPLFLYLINGTENFKEYHLLNLLFSSSIFIFIYIICFKCFKKSSLAIFGPIFLILAPRFLGHIPSNPKDVPFADYFFISLSLIYLSRGWEEKVRILTLGLSFGLTQGMRTIGYSIYPVYLVFSIYMYIKEKKRIKDYLHLFLEVILIFFIGFLVHVISQPFLGADPFNNFVYLLRHSKDFPWSNDVFFMGKNINSTVLPWHYLPIWFLISTPLFILVFFFVGLLMFEVGNPLFLLFFISLLVNLTIFFFVRPIIYDGMRHMIYLLPQMVVLSIFGFVKVMKNRKIRFLGILTFVIGSVFVLYNYVTLHPYEYVYFNFLTGGLKGAHGKFETDYWAESNGEALRWIRYNIADKQNDVIKIGACGNSFAISFFSYYNNYQKIKEAAIKDADYVICWERQGDHKQIEGKLIHTIYRQGVPLTHIFKTRQ